MAIARDERVRHDGDTGGDVPTGIVDRLARPITFRGDIEGLRAVAVLLVLADHAALPVTGGFIGVDVFFVISGFLITSLLLSELVTTRRISLREFYARRARRLLPGAAVVLAVTGVLTLLLVPRTRWLDVGYDMLASALYVQNWRLAGLAVDYQNQDALASPLQHFWSLAVEEQFYLLWPLLLVGVTVLMRSQRLRIRSRGPLTDASARTQRIAVRLVVIAISLIGVPSFVWSLFYTVTNPAGAYFVTTTRLWELAVGGVCAIVAARLSTMSRAAASALTTAGLLAIAAGAALYTASTDFPGYAALLPVLGAAAVLAGGQAAAGGGAGLLLDTPPMRWIGKLSYSLYLWHWPLVAIAYSIVGERTPLVGTAVVLGSFVPAYLCYRFVENPVRRSTKLRTNAGRSLGVGGACTAGATVAAFAVIATMWPPPGPSTPIPLDLSTLSSSGATAAPAVKRGAMVLADNPRDDQTGAPVDTVPSITPDPLAAKNDLGGNFCGADLLSADVRSCVGGDSFSGTDVALIGDSHAQQWTTALSAVAKERKWKLTAYTKAGCPFVEQDVAISLDDNGQQVATRPYTQCAEWREKLVDQLTNSPTPPKMIIVSSGEHLAFSDGRVLIGPESENLLVQGYRSLWKKFQDKGTKVVVLADTPTPKINVPDCVAENTDSLTKCTYPRGSSNASEGSAMTEAARSTPDVTFIDLTDAICPTEQCATVIGGVIVWRDSNHLSATYSSTLSPRLDKAIPRLP